MALLLVSLSGTENLFASLAIKQLLMHLAIQRCQEGQILSISVYELKDWVAVISSLIERLVS